MRLKSTITGLLAALLLLTSFAASACQVKCELGLTTVSCHAEKHGGGHTGHHDGSNMAGMSRPNQDRLTDTSSTPVAPDFDEQAPCAVHVCVQQVASTLQSGYSQQRLSATGNVSVDQTMLPSFEVATLSQIAETPPLAKHSPVTLHTTLRL